ncbi:ADP-ribosylation factor-binding protein GGA1 isoform X2 [Daktulosphaira vitifoliae]|uniref:ADP-ribosylation factor-binding protein GGA1 isoform X2 n=1 Tax=Daktulosphaira vitifoliae TaxID=58002 RepID=UPI0021AA06E3|nr:ADP-ribosylation factor-binding protein GGA1 isoform X2 [Daktulosphaira vitifoliae]
MKKYENKAECKRATRNSNEKLDSAALLAFSGFVQKDSKCAPIAAKYILSKIHSLQEWEALQALHLLDICMQTGSSTFQAEVGKFKFLNELIRLVSPKYSGIQTSEVLKNKIIDLLRMWSFQFPNNVKIQDAFTMLKKQGVVNDMKNVNRPPCELTSSTELKKASILNEEKSLLLQKLLKSKKPEDLKAANQLIKSMVEEEEQKTEKLNKMITDIDVASNSVKLLSEMLKSYNKESSSPHDLELIKELYTEVKKLEPSIKMILAIEIPDNEIIVRNIIHLSYEINEILNIYIDTIEKSLNKESNSQRDIEDLLDFNSLSVAPDSHDLLGSTNIVSSCINDALTSNTKIKHLFSNNNSPTVSVVNELENPNSSLNNEKNGQNEIIKNNLFEELNNLGKDLLTKLQKPNKVVKTFSAQSLDTIIAMKNCDSQDVVSFKLNESEQIENLKIDNNILKPISDLEIELENIISYNEPVFVNVFNKNDIITDIHLAANKLRDDTSVYVVTTKSENKKPINNFLFQPIIPNNCRLRLLSPSRTDLPIYNTFLPQVSIVQIFLIATRKKDFLPLKFVVSYTVDNEMITEFGIVKHLQLNNSC